MNTAHISDEQRIAETFREVPRLGRRYAEVFFYGSAKDLMDKASANFFLRSRTLLFLFARRGPTVNLRSEVSQSEGRDEYLSGNNKVNTHGIDSDHFAVTRPFLQLKRSSNIFKYGLFCDKILRGTTTFPIPRN